MRAGRRRKGGGDERKNEISMGSTREIGEEIDTRGGAGQLEMMLWMMQSGVWGTYQVSVALTLLFRCAERASQT